MMVFSFVMMSPSDLPWWGWLLLAVICWCFQWAIGEYTEEGSLRAWAFRLVLIAGAVLSALIAVVRFVKWVWQG